MVTDDDDSATTVEYCTDTETLECTNDSADSNNNGSFSSVSDVTNYSCNPTLDHTGPELVYTFEAAFDGDVTVSITGLSADLDLFALLDDGSSTCDPTTCIDSSTSSGSSDESLTVTVTDGQTWYIAVDGFNGAVSDFDIEIDCPGCAETWELTCVDVDDFANNGDFGSTDQVQEYGCNDALNESGPEYVYEFVAPIAGTFDVGLTGLSSDLDLFVLDGAGGSCDPSECVDHSASASTSDESATFVAAAAGDLYYLVVDGFAGNTSDFTITVGCPDSLCAEPEDTFTCAWTTMSGDNSTGDSAVNAWSGCSSSNNWTGPELVYEFVPAITGDYTFDLTGLSSDLDLFVVEAEETTGACDASGCIDYSNIGGNSDESVTVALESGVTYFVVVDGWSGNTSSFDLELSCPACATDYPLNCIANSDSWQNTYGPSNWSDYGCQVINENETGPEYIYVFNVAEDGDATVNLTGLAADLDLFVLEPATNGDCDPDECVDRSRNSGNADESITWSVLAGETYYIVVDGYSGATSSYTISLTCS